MSSRARLILLSGVGGSGTTTIAHATVAALAGEGLRPVLVDASGPASPDGGEPAVLAAIAGSVGRAFADLGADPLLPEEWFALPGVALLGALEQMRQAVADPTVDVVVVDAGNHVRARELVDLPASLGRLLDSALTPRLAMWRSAGSASSDGAGTLFESMSTVRADVQRLRSLLAHPSTTMRLVTRPEVDAVHRTARALAVFALLGVAVDGVVLNRFPRKSEEWPKDVRADARAAEQLMSDLADGVPVWTSTSAIRPVPKDRSAMGPLGRVRVLDAEQLTVQVDDEAFALVLPLAGPAHAEAVVGRQGDRLVVAFDGCLRWLDLPPVLRRCRATHADRIPEGLRLSFVPSPGLWSRPAEAS